MEQHARRQITGSSPGGFAPTRWTLVERTRGNTAEAKAALRELCEAYYAPVTAFIRREGYAHEEARDQAHEFFARILSGDSLGNAERSCGRFRSYLLGAVKHFLLNQRRDAARKKRGAGRDALSIGPGTDTSPGVDVADTHALPPDEIFDREWALAIIERALAALQQECTAAGQAVQFAVLKQWLSPADIPRSQADAAAELGMTEGALKVAIHRLRQRFRALVRNDIAQTLNDPAELDAEMQHLVQALASQARNP